MSTPSLHNVMNVKCIFEPTNAQEYEEEGVPCVPKDLSSFFLLDCDEQVSVKFDADMRLIVQQYDGLVVHNYPELSQLLPNVTHLSVVATHDSSQPGALCSIPLGLVLLWPNLKVLSVVGNRYVRDGRANLTQAIRQLHSLKSLSVDVEPYLLNLPDRIEHLTVRLSREGSGQSEHRVDLCGRAFVEFMQEHTHLRTVGLWYDESYNLDYSTWPDNVCTKVTQLAHVQPSSEEDLSVICAKFSSLRHLHFGHTSLTLERALQCLSQLAHLTRLAIAIDHSIPAANCARLESVHRVHFLNHLDPNEVASFRQFFPNATELTYED